VLHQLSKFIFKSFVLFIVLVAFLENDGLRGGVMDVLDCVWCLLEVLLDWTVKILPRRILEERSLFDINRHCDRVQLLPADSIKPTSDHCQALCLCSFRQVSHCKDELSP